VAYALVRAASRLSRNLAEVKCIQTQYNLYVAWKNTLSGESEVSAARDVPAGDRPLLVSTLAFDFV
jgi:hypothetical protein